MKRLIALLLAVSMVMSFALTASAETTSDSYTLPDLDCTGWWAAHTDGVEITADGITITFTNTTYATASSNWNTALWVLYTGNEAKVNGDGYMEYWVHRSDNYGWGNTGYYTAELPANTWLNTAYPDNVAANGIIWEGSFEDGCWDNWVADSQAGENGTVTAKLVGSNAVITISYHGVTNTLTLPVDTSKPVYLSMTGELCTLSDISVIENNPTVPKTGDSISVFVALMAISAVGIAVVLKKKEF